MEFNKSVKLNGNIKRTVSWNINWDRINPTSPSEIAIAEILQHIVEFEQTLDSEKETTCLLSESAAGTFMVERIVPTSGSLVRVEGRTQEGSRIWRMVHIEQFAFVIMAKQIEADDEEQNPIGFVIFKELEARSELNDEQDTKK
jgi:hypothetical protein